MIEPVSVARMAGFDKIRRMRRTDNAIAQCQVFQLKRLKQHGHFSSPLPAIRVSAAHFNSVRWPMTSNSKCHSLRDRLSDMPAQQFTISDTAEKKTTFQGLLSNGFQSWRPVQNLSLQIFVRRMLRVRFRPRTKEHFLQQREQHLPRRREPEIPWSSTTSSAA